MLSCFEDGWDEGFGLNLYYLIRLFIVIFAFSKFLFRFDRPFFLAGGPPPAENLTPSFPLPPNQGAAPGQSTAENR
jgi:hypothetical protein